MRGKKIKTEWRKKKQTKAQSARAKRAKLDPDAVRSAADVRRVDGEVQLFGEGVKSGGDDDDDDGEDSKGKRKRKRKKKGRKKQGEGEGGDDVGEKAEEIQLDRLTLTTRLGSPDDDGATPNARAKPAAKIERLNAKRGIEDLGSPAAPEAQGQAKRQRRKDTGSRIKEVS